MSTPSDFAVISLADEPGIAALCGCDRVLVEAVELHGAAIVQGFAVHWTERGGEYEAAAWLEVPEEHRAIFERLFVEARAQAKTPDYHEARHGWRHTKPASKPLRPCAPVRLGSKL